MNLPAPPTSSALAVANIPPPPGFVGDMEQGLGATATSLRTTGMNQPPPPPPSAGAASMPRTGGPRPPGGAPPASQPKAPWAEKEAGKSLIDPGGARVFPFPAVGVGLPVLGIAPDPTTKAPKSLHVPPPGARRRFAGQDRAPRTSAARRSGAWARRAEGATGRGPHRGLRAAAAAAQQVPASAAVGAAAAGRLRHAEEALRRNDCARPACSA